MRKGINFPFSFEPGDRVKLLDGSNRIYVVESVGDNSLFQIFDPYQARIKTDYKCKYDPYKPKTITACLVGFLKKHL